MSTGIAIIGMAGRFPGARNLHEFWQNLRNGVECVAHPSDADLAASGIPAEIWRKPNYVRAAATVEGVDRFDAEFFGITPREAEILDPQQRLVLECAWEALEDAAYDPATCGLSIGVYAGAAMSSYLGNLSRNPEVMRSFSFFQLMLANDKDHLATRLAYKLDLRGPAVGIQTACSTSLVAVHIACEALLSRQCDLAIAAGVMIRVSPFGGQEPGYLYEEGGITSPDGRCRAFDAAAQGTVFGNGIGVVVLKCLKDALADGDYIHAVIKGTAVNNDGAARVGYSAPSVDGQAKVIAEALAISGVDVNTIGYIEAHGSGTPLGDPIEVLALSNAYRARTARRQFCAIGSVKPNVGHLETAAGMAGLIKAVLALKHREIPPLLFFDRANPAIDFSNSPFYVPTELRSWPDTGAPRRAGVSSFGMGGTNAHIVLEEAPAPIPQASPLPPLHLLQISARSSAALEALTADIAIALALPPPGTVADIAFTLRAGRHSFNHRRIIVCRDAEDARDALTTMDPSRVSTGECQGTAPRVAFLFPGEGEQHIDMGRELYEVEPGFRQEFDDGAKILNSYLGLDLRQLLYPAPHARQEASAMLSRTALAQPAMFLVEYALARTIMRWGIQPDALLGDGVGELVAATLSGVFSVSDAFALVAARGRIVEDLPAGGMVAVALSHAEVRTMLGSRLAIAAINGPDSCVVSGPVGTISTFESRLGSRGIRFRRLQASRAFHSPMMDPAVAKFADCVARVERKPPSRRFIANATGSWITTSQAVDPAYWGRHLRECVLLSDGLRTIVGGASVLVEVGPGNGLSNLARRQLTGTRVIETMRGRPEERSDYDAFLSGIGKVWLSGVSIRSPQPFRRVPLPSYPFERQRYWINPVYHPASREELDFGGDKYTTPVWMRSAAEAVAQPPADLLVVGSQDGACDSTLRSLNTLGARAWSSSAQMTGNAARHVVLLWPAGGEIAWITKSLSIIQQMTNSKGACAIWIVASGMYAVRPGERVCPHKAAFENLVRLLARECDATSVRAIDPGDREADCPVLPDILRTELGAPASATSVAYRSNQRWVRVQHPVSCAVPLGSAPRCGTTILFNAAPHIARVLAGNAHCGRTITIPEDTGDEAQTCDLIEAAATSGNFTTVVYCDDAQDGNSRANLDGDWLAAEAERARSSLRKLARFIEAYPVNSAIVWSQPSMDRSATVRAGALDAAVINLGMAGGFTWKRFKCIAAESLGSVLHMNAVELVGNDTAASAQSMNPLQIAFPSGSYPTTTSTEIQIVRIWKDLLGVDRISPADRFFDVGGDSLTATQMGTRLREQFGIDVPLKEVLSNPSVRSLAARIDDGKKLPQATTQLGRELRDSAIPLSFAQQRLFILDNLAPGNPFYNVPVAVNVRGALDTNTLARAVEAVAERHEVLRTTFEIREGSPAQVIHDSLPPEFTVLDLQDWPPERREPGALTLVTQEARRPFSLLRGPMVRVLVLRLAPERTTVVFTMHHIAVDAWSVGIFLKELALHYKLLSEHQSPALQPLPVQYADFAIWQRRSLGDGKASADLSYWTKQLAGAPDLKLRFMRAAPAHPTFAGATKTVRLSPSTAGHLEALAHAEDATLFMVLLTAFQIVLRHHSGLDDVVVGTDVANRRHAETERLIGFFVNQVVLRTDLSGNPSFIESLRRVRRVALEAFEHQDVPFDRLVEAMNPPRDARGLPLFQMKFVLQNAPASLPSMDGLKFSPIHVESGTAKFVLLFNCERNSDGILGSLEYSTEMFDSSDIAQMLADFELVADTAARSPEESLLQLDTILDETAHRRHETAQQAREVMKRQMLANVSRRSTLLNPEQKA